MTANRASLLIRTLYSSRWLLIVLGMVETVWVFSKVTGAFRATGGHFEAGSHEGAVMGPVGLIFGLGVFAFAIWGVVFFCAVIGTVKQEGHWVTALIAMSLMHVLFQVLQVAATPWSGLAWSTFLASTYLLTRGIQLSNAG